MYIKVVWILTGKARHSLARWFYIHVDFDFKLLLSRVLFPVYSADMASSVSGKDEPNSVLWLATRADKMALSFPLGFPRSLPQENSALFPYNILFMSQAYSVKMTRYWPLFGAFMDFDSVSLNIQPSPRLVNNSYLKPPAKTSASIFRWPQLVVWLSIHSVFK